MQYTWQPEQKLSISGLQLAVFNAIIESHMNYVDDGTFNSRVAKAEQTMRILDGKNAFQEILEQGIKDGWITQVDNTEIEAKTIQI